MLVVSSAHLIRFMLQKLLNIINGDDINADKTHAVEHIVSMITVWSKL